MSLTRNFIGWTAHHAKAVMGQNWAKRSPLTVPKQLKSVMQTHHGKFKSQNVNVKGDQRGYGIDPRRARLDITRSMYWIYKCILPGRAL